GSGTTPYQAPSRRPPWPELLCPSGSRRLGLLAPGNVEQSSSSPRRGPECAAEIDPPHVAATGGKSDGGLCLFLSRIGTSRARRRLYDPHGNSPVFAPRGTGPCAIFAAVPSRQHPGIPEVGTERRHGRSPLTVLHRGRGHGLPPHGEPLSAAPVVYSGGVCCPGDAPGYP